VHAIVRIDITVTARLHHGCRGTALRRPEWHTDNTRLSVNRMQITGKCNETCKMSSKSRAANRFISDVLLENVRMTPLPNAGTCRNLQKMLSVDVCNSIPYELHVPVVESRD
jgi:hypothetical protein